MKTSPPMPGEVIRGCRAGNRQDFETLVGHYQKKVFNIAYRILGNLEEAKDLAQEVFITVFESIRGLREEVKFEPWLTQITLNHCRNRWKYLKRRQYFKTDPLDDPVETEDGTMPKAFCHKDDPASLYERKMIRERVQEGLLRLQEDQRELIVLRDLQGFSYEEMETILGIPMGTVKSRLHRTRMELKEILEESNQ
jgi:RNA polymerase sigma-70 factor (ECF subfamily)